MRTTTIALSSLLAFTPLLGAQQKPVAQRGSVGQQGPGARAFFPKDYESELFFDLDELREREVLDLLERGVGKMVFGQIGKEFGVDFEDIDRLRMVGTWRREQAESSQYVEMVPVFLLEGKKVALPEPPAEQSDWHKFSKDKIGAYDVLSETRGSRNTLTVLPRPGLLVKGDTEFVTSVLAGQHKGGVPRHELLALTAGKKPLAYFATGRFGLTTEQWWRNTPFPQAWHSDADPLDLILIRFDEVEEDSFAATMTLRFGNGKSSPARFVKELQAKFDEWSKHKQLGALKKIWKGMRVATEEADVVVSYATGNARQTVGVISQLIPLMLMGTTVEQSAVAEGPVLVDAEIVEQEAVKPKQAQKGDKKKGDKKK